MATPSEPITGEVVQRWLGQHPDCMLTLHKRGDEYRVRVIRVPDPFTVNATDITGEVLGQFTGQTVDDVLWWMRWPEAEQFS